RKHRADPDDLVLGKGTRRQGERHRGSASQSENIPECHGDGLRNALPSAGIACCLVLGKRGARIRAVTVPACPRLRAGTTSVSDLLRYHISLRCRHLSTAIEVNHAILSARNRRASADFLAEMLGLQAARRWGLFSMVRTDNDAFLDYMDSQGELTSQP